MNETKPEAPCAEKVDLKLRRRTTPALVVKSGVRAGRVQVTPL